jgi:hypothetical protein
MSVTFTLRQRFIKYQPQKRLTLEHLIGKKVNFTYQTKRLMMKRLCAIVLMFILLTIMPLISAYECPALVKQALAATDTLCSATENNQACYGNISLQAKPNSNIKDFIFSQPGDQVNISDIKSLQLSPMSPDTGEWGVAVLKVEANSPATKPTILTLLAFGDVTLENEVASPTILDVQNDGPNAINVRLTPNINAGIIGSLKPKQTVTALERLGDGSWLRVKLPDSEQMGWVKSDFMSTAGNIRTLNIVDGSQPQYRPMQAFTFKSGSDTQNCAEVPQNGLLIQTPEGSGEVKLWVNQVVVKLGSTVYFQAQPSGDMVITTVEGHATIEAMGITHTAVAGTSIHIKLDEDLHPVEPPSMPQPYQLTTVANLPIDHLQRKITIHKPLTDAEVASIQRSQNAIDCSHGKCSNGPNNASVDTKPKDPQNNINPNGNKKP